jgi:hypothetical protein
VFKTPPHRWLVISIISQLILTAVLMQIPSIRDSFGVIKPTSADLEIILGFGIIIFISMEIVKAVIRARMAKKAV